MNFKHIHIGEMIEKIVAESGIEISRLCNFMKFTEEEITKTYNEENLPTDVLLKWSKILEYDFFRIYTQHLILYAPIKSENTNREKSLLPQFRKNIYTREIIDFILERIRTNEMSKNEVIERYRIPKTTLYKWISKYSLIKAK